MSQTTIVTAFYPLTKAKHTMNSYIEWIKLFCKIPKHMVIYTNEELYKEIYEYRKDYINITSVIIKPFHTFHMTSPEMMLIWEKTYMIDPEYSYHSPELYAIWAIKQECVMYTIKNNPFNSRWFAWCDIGIQRHSTLIDYYTTFTDKVPDLCDTGRLSFLEIKYINDKYINIWKNKIKENIETPYIAIGGGCIVGDIESWEDFSDSYASYIIELHNQNIFIGKDQHIFFRMLINRIMKKPFRLFHAQQFCDIPYIYWMSFPVILGGKAHAIIDTRFEENDEITI